MLGGRREGYKIDGGTREITGHSVQGGSSDGVALWVLYLGCDIRNDDSAGWFPP